MLVSTNPRTLLFALAALSLGTSCQQPLMYCTTAHGAAAVAYELKSGNPDSPCGGLVGDVVGLQTYFSTGGRNGTPDYGKSLAALRPESVGLLIERAESQGLGVEGDGTPNAVGPFTTAKPVDDFCQVDEFSVAELSLPEVPAVADDPETEDDETLPAQPATTIRLEWTNFRLLTTPDAQGTQFTVDLKYTRDDCTAEYSASGLYPVVGCATDEDCTAEGTGINPDFAVRCHAGLKLCVLAEEPPSYE